MIGHLALSISPTHFLRNGVVAVVYSWPQSMAVEIGCLLEGS